jgi:hypothetical protein
MASDGPRCVCTSDTLVDNHVAYRASDFTQDVKFRFANINRVLRLAQLRLDVSTGIRGTALKHAGGLVELSCKPQVARRQRRCSIREIRPTIPLKLSTAS